MSNATDLMVKEMATDLAAQVWCREDTEHIEMDVNLASAFTDVLAVWIETARQAQSNCDFYRDLLDRCAEQIGKEAYVADDGSVMDEPVRLKIPELIAAIKRQL